MYICVYIYHKPRYADKSEGGVGSPPQGGSLARGQVDEPAARGCPAGTQKCGNVSVSLNSLAEGSPITLLDSLRGYRGENRWHAHRGPVGL